MNEPFSLHPSRILWLLIGGGIGINALLWLLSFLLFPQESPAAILHYSIGIGIDFVGEGGKIIMLPVIGTIFIIVNTLVGYAVRSISYRAAWMVFISIPLVQLILLAAFAFLWRINIS